MSKAHKWRGFMLNVSVVERINTIRNFNRFITRRIGALREGILHSDYSLTEARIIFEIAQRDQVTASDLTKELGLDAGYQPYPQQPGTERTHRKDSL